MKDFVRKYIQTEHIDELALYLVVLFNFKSKVPTEYDQEPVERAKDFRILWSNYSKRGYNKVHESKCLRILVNNISESKIPNSEKSCLEHLWESERVVSKKSESYKLVFEDLFERWKKTA